MYQTLPRIICVGLLCLLVTGASYAVRNAQLKELFYNEVLYHVFQDDYFTAIRLLDHELVRHYGLDNSYQNNSPQNTFYNYRKSAQLSIGDLELSYRMHQQAGRSIQRLFQDNLDQNVQNIAAFRMARILFDKGQYTQTIHALQLVRAVKKKALQEDVDMLRALAEMTQQNYAKAIVLLTPLKFSQKHKHYALYNLGVAYLRSNKAEKGARLLQRLGQLETSDQEILALQDKANLVLGSRYLDEGYAQLAKPILDRIRVNGPFSNRSLLKSGWADVALKNFESALHPWSILHKRDTSDLAVQESLLALPFAYSKLERYERAALLYAKAIERLSVEINKLNNAINGIRDDRLLYALSKNDDKNHRRFLRNISNTAGTPEVRYLFRLLASHDFNESVKNYRDLLFIQENLAQLQRNVDAYHELVNVRIAYYQPLLPQAEEVFSILDAAYGRIMTRKDYVQQRIETIQRLHDPKTLASKEELRLEKSLLSLENRLNTVHDQRSLQDIRRRINRLKGILAWDQQNLYETRVSNLHQHLREVDDNIDAMQNTHVSVRNNKREAYQSFIGYDVPFKRVNKRISDQLQTTKKLLRQQGNFINRVAIIELDKRLQKLRSYKAKARTALAENYNKTNQKNINESDQTSQIKNNIKTISQRAVIPEESLQNHHAQLQVGIDGL